MKKISNIILSFCIFTISFIGCKTISMKDNANKKSDNIEKAKTLKEFLKKDEINLNWLLGTWENDSSIIYIRSDGTFRHGFKESEGFNGKWSLLDDGTLYISDCQIYDEEPWGQKYKIKVCMQNRLTLIGENGFVYDLHPLKSH